MRYCPHVASQMGVTRRPLYDGGAAGARGGDLSSGGVRHVRLAIPLLHVSDSRAAEEFYCEKLGFDLVSATRATTDADPCYVALQREGALIHLSSFAGDGTAGAAVVFAVDDVDALHAEFLTRGVRIHVDPVDQTWGNREMYIKDADGNSLRFVSRPRAR